jgi:chemotaxis response regulator CheB
MYVLVVSKNSQFRKLCIDSLVTRGHMAVGVANFSEGERLLQKAQPDVIIMCPSDCHDADVQKIRSHYQLRLTPIMMISSDRPDRDWAKNWKVNAIPYPVDGRRLIDALAPLLAH